MRTTKDITDNIFDTAEIIKPIYNFKAASDA